MVLRGHFDGQRIVLDDPIPPDIKPDTPVTVSFGNGDTDSVLARIAKLAAPGGLPTDYSQQHEHYVKSTPRR